MKLGHILEGCGCRGVGIGKPSEALEIREWAGLGNI